MAKTFAIKENLVYCELIRNITITDSSIVKLLKFLSPKNKATLALIALISLPVLLYFFYNNFFLINKTLAITEESVVYESDLDFGSGTSSSVQIIGTGNDAAIELSMEGGFNNSAYRREIVINNSANSNSLTEYQIVIRDLDTATLISEGKMQDDCDDLRFTDSNDVEIDYWIGPGTCDTSNSIVYVKTPSIPASSNATINMYYGNPDTASGKDEASTFSYSAPKNVGYLLSDALSAQSDIGVISLVEDNTISFDGNNWDLDKGEIQSFNNAPGFVPWDAEGLFQIGKYNHSSDSIVPISWAGTQFYLYNYFASGTTGVKIYAIAPWGDATVDIYANGVLECADLDVTAMGNSHECISMTGSNTIRIVSSWPILLYSELYYSGAYHAKLPTPPAQVGEWIGTSGNSWLVNGSASAADYTIHYSNVASPSNENILANSSFNILDSTGYHGGSPAFKTDSNDPGSILGLNTGIGILDTTFYSKVEEMGTVYGVPYGQTMFISIASLYPATCTVYDADNDTLLYTGTASSSNNEVYFLGFGTGSSGVHIGPEWYMECDYPVQAFHRKFGVNAEVLNWRHEYMRQYTYPEPTPAVGSEEVLFAPSGIWESSNELSDVIDLVWNGGWGDGNPSSTAFSANLSNIGINGNITFQIRTASQLDQLASASYTTIGVANSSPFSLTAQDLENLGVLDGFNRYIQIRATLTTNLETETPSLESFSLFYLHDDLAPVDNVTNVAFTLDAPDDYWFSTPPQIVWNPADDDPSGSGIMGYCISLDQTEQSDPPPNNDPETSAGVLQGLESEIEHPACPFIVASEAFDPESVVGLELENSMRYYLSIKAIDNAGNVYSGGGFQNLLSFRMDFFAPKNVDYIVIPNQLFGSIDDISFGWPSEDPFASNDIHEGQITSGVQGWQYSINSNSNWKGPAYDNVREWYYIENDSSTYTYNFSSVEDGGDFIAGDNVIYFRTVDTAGNVSSYVTGVVSYLGEAPQFPEGSELLISPDQNDENSFSLSWPDAIAQDGNAIASYYYMINRNPPATYSTLSANSSVYIPTILTSVSEGELIGAVKGNNTVCVVAVDNENNYASSSKLCSSFELNSSLPDPVQNLFVTDTSIKETQLWRSTIVWDEPEYKGAGDLTYTLERSEDGSDWSEIVTTKGLAVTDIVEESKLYYYRIATFDITDESINDPSYSASVAIIPQGSYIQPPDLITGPKILSLSTTSVTINWTTDRLGDSRIQYGLSSGDYFDEEQIKSLQTADHEVTLINLRPGTQYFYRARWMDQDGNIGESNQFSFFTAHAPVVTDPTIIRIGLDYATLRFTVENAAASEIQFGKTSEFGGSERISTSSNRSTYIVNLEGLDDSSKYFYKINTFDQDNNEYEGVVLNFTTLARPFITDVRIQEVRNSSQPTILISWLSNTPISSVITYYPLDDQSLVNEAVDIELVKGEHQLKIENLKPETRYALVVSGSDSQGNEAFSDTQTFTTATDTRPPQISDVRIESSLIQRDDGTTASQLVVSWSSDEQATSQVEYGEGNSASYSESTRVNQNLSVDHLVVISDLNPSSVYHLRIISKDDQGNQTISNDFITLTPRSTQSAFDLVLSGLREAFGFL